MSSRSESALKIAKSSPWPTAEERGRERQLKREAVLHTAVQSFNERGFHATSLDEVAESLNVTKPTIYHYFGSTQNFEAALLDHYETVGTGQPIDLVATSTTPQQKMQHLFRLATQAPHPGLDRAIRNWASHDAKCEARQVKIDAARVGFVAQLAIEMGFEAAAAAQFARIAYAILIGGQQLQPALAPSEIEAMLLAWLQASLPL